MRGDTDAVADLVARARVGDTEAWNAIVERFAALLWSVCRRHDLSRADAEEVVGAVWLRLVEHLERITEPAALPGWLATTTRRECLALLRSGRRQIPVDDPDPDPEPGVGERVEDAVLAEERNDALRAALADLSERCRALLALLFAESPVPYDEISSSLGMPVGAIGPTRARCLARLRAHRALTAIAPASVSSR